MATISARVLNLAIDALENDHDDTGFCIRCLEEHDCCEPDAREYPCECCGSNTVYGAEEIVMMGA